MARAYLAISIVTLFWAANFTVGKFATDEFNPYLLSAIRVVLTGVLFYALLPREERRISKSDLSAVLPLAITGIAINHVCFAAGIERTTPSHSAILHAIIPVCVAVMAWLMIRERLRPAGMVGLAMAVCGALVVVLGAGGGSVPSEFRGDLIGDMITIVGVVAFSFYNVWGRKILGGRGDFRTLALAFFIAIPLVLPLLIYGALVQDWSRLTWKGWTALAYMWGCCNLIAYRLHIYALSRLSAGRVAAFIDIQPGIGIAIAVLAGRDQITESLVLGAGIALAGVILVQFRR